MSNAHYTPPKYGADGFNCPHLDCNFYAEQMWLEEFVSMEMQRFAEDDGYGNIDDYHTVGAYYPSKDNKDMPIYRISRCRKCKKYSLWMNKKLVYPYGGFAPPPNSDLPKDAMKRYKEAAIIASVSPAAAGVLLRRILESLCDREEAKGESLYDKIEDLVKRKALSSRTQGIMHSIRDGGNKGAHPGMIDLNEKPKIVAALFHLLNYVAEQILTSDKHSKRVESALKRNKKTEKK